MGSRDMSFRIGPHPSTVPHYKLHYIPDLCISVDFAYTFSP